MRKAKKLLFQKWDESYTVESFDMDEVEKICVGRASNLVMVAYQSENDISDQEQVAVVYLRDKPNRCFSFKGWEMSFLYDIARTDNE